MKYGLSVVVFLLGILIACSGPREIKEGWEIIVKGKVGFPQKGLITISEIRQDGKQPVEDTILLKGDYSFEKKIRIKEPGYYRLNFYQRQIVNIILDKSNLEVNVDGNDSNGFYEVKGSPDLDLIGQVQKIIRDVQQTDEIKALEIQFQEAARTHDEVKLKEIQGKYLAMLDEAYGKVAAILLQQPPSLGLINFLQNGNSLDRDKYFSVYVSAADKLRKEWPNNSYARNFVTYVDNLKKTAIGQPAPEITLPDPDGKIITLSSFKGKFVLVDFWAKWCGPCRQENPNVVKAYNEFKGKNFDILGVSLDRSKQDWVKAIQEDGLVWNHVSDLKYFDSQAAHDYNINGIPFSILVDPSGIIIAKNLRGLELQKKLREVLVK